MIRRAGKARRRGFTLVELLLVLALAVVLAALSWPAVRGPLSRMRLRQSAGQLEAIFAEAKYQAITTGDVYEVRYQRGGGRLEWSPSVLFASYAEEEVKTTSEDTPSRRHEFSLPPGIAFADDATTLSVDDGVDAVSSAERAGVGETDDASRDWSEPIWFYPDGTSSDAVIRLASRLGVAVQVRLRGLTGTARVEDADPQRVDLGDDSTSPGDSSASMSEERFEAS